ncbi:hypothetical protein GLOIN_2v1599039 [Rhizophagus irregularis DAOM 181602=DAOM 197198]|uniref:Uncharacterized protein n=1 Tax=Rhizophagus irregularis (strain DAOM 181602 / DAOM 197198 / MUCL 43194) TaxID=747089 RepID=A0A2P4Q3H1_RHIID|nr:hypothetical protein GLOIN_2v1599039 [Rhizophagus irregularis DAOM 181602=DAOM 197198]POG72180.1 hypothetical protein GLOIN_2v1599039 [Rhizophagus irregularis DAOM 181602=DAOM 197198]|eukprot:XP_025179046.1 hypothetical protein GLOIN_2v1599039 [Rhizophagus irregularis DAOM 181602=DAOM 197198]
MKQFFITFHTNATTIRMPRPLSLIINLRIIFFMVQKSSCRNYRNYRKFGIAYQKKNTNFQITRDINT